MYFFLSPKQFGKVQDYTIQSYCCCTKSLNYSINVCIRIIIFYIFVRAVNYSFNCRAGIRYARTVIIGQTTDYVNSYASANDAVYIEINRQITVRMSRVKTVYYLFNFRVTSEKIVYNNICYTKFRTFGIHNEAAVSCIRVKIYYAYQIILVSTYKYNVYIVFTRRVCFTDCGGQV